MRQYLVKLMDLYSTLLWTGMIVLMADAGLTPDRILGIGAALGFIITCVRIVLVILAQHLGDVERREDAA